MDFRKTFGWMVPASDDVSYSLRDEFTTDRAAGAVNGTLAEPGGNGGTPLNTRTVVDAENKLSISDGRLTFAGGKAFPAYGDPGEWYGVVARVPGRMFLVTGNVSSFSLGAFFGFDSGQSGIADRDVVSLRAASDLRLYDGGLLTQTAGPIAGATDYQVAIVLRSIGAYFFIKGGVYSKWTLFWVGSRDSTANLYPVINNYNAVFTADRPRIPVATWLPTPLVYDTLTRANGAPGSSETTGPDSQAVVARAWATQSGTWAISSNKLVATAAGIITLPSVGNGDYFISAKVTLPASGTTPGGIIVRWINTTNYWYLKITPGTAGTDFELVEVNDGTPTTRASTDVGWVANTEYTIKISVRGSNLWQIFVDDVSKITYTTVNTFNATATIIGFRDEVDSNLKFDNLLVFGAGSNSDYSQLNGY